MKTNEDLQKDVQNAIKWEPSLNAAEIGVIAKDGIITLSGTVDSYLKKTEAEDAAKNTAGVKAVVEKIVIKFSNDWSKDDNEIASEILTALKWNWQGPADKLKIKVESGWITLGGELEWHYQKDAAEAAVKNQPGVKGVTSNITIKSDTHDSIEKKDIEEALLRNWSIDDEAITVRVSGNSVTLNGRVNSFYEKDEAERIAWNAPGVWNVNNELLIEHK